MRTSVHVDEHMSRHMMPITGCKHETTRLYSTFSLVLCSCVVSMSYHDIGHENQNKKRFDFLVQQPTDESSTYVARWRRQQLIKSSFFNDHFTHHLFADDHLFNAHDLRNVVRSRFEFAVADPLVNTSQQLRIYVTASIDTFKCITHTHTSSASSIHNRCPPVQRLRTMWASTHLE